MAHLNSGNLQILRTLMDANADLHTLDKQGRKYAISTHTLSLALALALCAISLLSVSCTSILHAAAYGGSEECTSKLIGLGVAAVQDNQQSLPLHVWCALELCCTLCLVLTQNRTCHRLLHINCSHTCSKSCKRPLAMTRSMLSINTAGTVLL
jgi:hypothetical protein